MSFPPPPDGTAGPAGADLEALSPAAVEEVLADFRAWLEQAATTPAPSPPTETVDLHTLVAQFVALRQEVNLQTRATRAQQEQNALALEQLGRALEELRRRADEATPDEDARLRPVLKTLVDAYDALALAAREVQRVRDTIGPLLDRLGRPEPAAAGSSRPGFWSRWFGAPAARTEPDRQVAADVERLRPFFDSLVTGYTMSLQRLERGLGDAGLEPIAATGEAFDPERMEVVAVDTESRQAPGTVVAEVRRGYLWRGRVFRYAQVSVARAS